MDTDYLKRVGRYIVTALLALGIIVYFGYHIWSTFKPDVKTEAVFQSTVTKAVDVDGYIFRSEVPLSANSGGTVVPSVSEGERVRAYGEAAGIYSSADPDTVEKINEIDVQIEMLSSVSVDSTITLKDAAKIDNELYSVMTQIRRALAKGDSETANNLRAELISGTNKKDILMGNSGNVAVRLSELRMQRSALVSQLGSRTETVTTPKSGYYYSESDGYETLFDPAVFDGADYDTLKNLVNVTPSAASNAGKIVTDSKWYTVCFVDSGIGAHMKEGQWRNVTFAYNGDITLEMKLEQLIRGENGYACVFSTTDMPDSFEYTRVQPVKIAMAEYTGFKVRISDVRIIDGKQGVYVLDGSTVRFRLISIITDYEGYYIVETDPEVEIPEEGEETEPSDQETSSEEKTYRYLKLHDLIITEGTGLYDGRILGK
ncbi:MAG: hypothetical protein IKK26_00160 [Clostridia bacterium]|nr:hypothetical protein [Clostridia bacterium]